MYLHMSMKWQMYHSGYFLVRKPQEKQLAELNVSWQRTAVFYVIFGCLTAQSEKSQGLYQVFLKVLRRTRVFWRHSNVFYSKHSIDRSLNLVIMIQQWDLNMNCTITHGLLLHLQYRRQNVNKEGLQPVHSIFGNLLSLMTLGLPPLLPLNPILAVKSYHSNL